ncbi:pyridoxamine 5'-phosphate oxidase family protein [Candidatus Galacturonibacter soehngenii]|uniref:Pyridoxamine 5'-phosphate oxidase family protein n=1 Tax=Candidatus Galacturonatibacter soehngenii TaxID=2307010 RepID=A0A7V7QIZ3_9FIRM|nr:pyridoxamine 5'-phosphate oxidase family protein [Candidatus Galacturonibacter soehngenii]KAB1437517.1 pyridoxamine 5'-phosphate oxidase family protein [Candidatus Galacturonibacter soehngenii]MBA4688455.1 pyridoxamine 5'-phosphate oxidase family protein [Candidatus Galacturonibacter soehngenii]
MFRTMRRFKQAVSEEECKKILTEEKRGTFSVIGDDGYPYSLPINFYYDEKENRIYFHGAKQGHKVDAINNCDKVCFTIWNTGFKKEGCWEWNVTSVIVFGRASLIEDRKITEDKSRKLALKYYPTKEEVEKEIALAIDRVQLFAIDIEHMTGKLVNEK